jgi:hypothetical protein
VAFGSSVAIYDEDGSLVLKSRLPAEIGAFVIKALNAAVNDPAVRNVSAETRWLLALMGDPVKRCENR